MEGIRNDANQRRARMRTTYNSNSEKMSATSRAAAEVEMQDKEEKYNSYFSSKKYKDNEGWVKNANQKRADIRNSNETYKANPDRYDTAADKVRQSSTAGEINNKFNLGNEKALSSLNKGADKDTKKQSKSLTELQSRLKSIGAEANKASNSLKNVVGDEIAQKYVDYANKVKSA
jgi:hypothetical protein